MNRKYDGIFGTPTDLMFNLEPSRMHPDVLEDWLFVLASENNRAMETPNKQGYFKTGDSAEFIFLTCDRLRLQPQAKFIAIELFDRFMVEHVKVLYDHVQRSDSRTKVKDWLSIQERVKTQMMLRVVSCCQLASKLSSHYKIVTPRKVKTTLQEFGHCYSIESILQSELRVLKTLNYKVMVTSPLTYIETMLEILGHNDSSINVNRYYGVTLKLLELSYMKRTQFYTQLYSLAIGELQKSPERLKLAGVEQDQMLLAISVIAAASNIVSPSQTDKVIEKLGRILQTNTENILDCATVLINLILECNRKRLFSWSESNVFTK